MLKTVAPIVAAVLPCQSNKPVTDTMEVGNGFLVLRVIQLGLRIDLQLGLQPLVGAVVRPVDILDGLAQPIVEARVLDDDRRHVGHGLQMALAAILHALLALFVNGLTEVAGFHEELP